MPKRELVLYGDSVLRWKAEPVAEVTDEIRGLVEDMYRVMYEEGGIGLAAPQAGVSLRVFVIDVPGETEGESVRRAFINPRILSSRRVAFEEEGCLSLPGIREKVERAANVTVAATDATGEPFEMEASDLIARVIQHELDHLDGILFVDRISSIRRSLLKRQLADIAAGKVPKENGRKLVG